MAASQLAMTPGPFSGAKPAAVSAAMPMASSWRTGNSAVWALGSAEGCLPDCAGEVGLGPRAYGGRRAARVRKLVVIMAAAGRAWSSSQNSWPCWSVVRCWRVPPLDVGGLPASAAGFGQPHALQERGREAQVVVAGLGYGGVGWDRGHENHGVRTIAGRSTGNRPVGTPARPGAPAAGQLARHHNLSFRPNRIIARPPARGR